MVGIAAQPPELLHQLGLAVRGEEHGADGARFAQARMVRHQRHLAMRQALGDRQAPALVVAVVEREEAAAVQPASTVSGTSCSRCTLARRIGDRACSRSASSASQPCLPTQTRSGTAAAPCRRTRVSQAWKTSRWFFAGFDRADRTSTKGLPSRRPPAAARAPPRPAPVQRHGAARDLQAGQHGPLQPLKSSPRPERNWPAPHRHAGRARRTSGRIRRPTPRRNAPAPPAGCSRAGRGCSGCRAAPSPPAPGAGSRGSTRRCRD